MKQRNLCIYVFLMIFGEKVHKRHFGFSRLNRTKKQEFFVFVMNKTFWYVFIICNIISSWFSSLLFEFFGKIKNAILTLICIKWLSVDSSTIFMATRFIQNIPGNNRNATKQYLVNSARFRLNYYVIFFYQENGGVYGIWAFWHSRVKLVAKIYASVLEDPTQYDVSFWRNIQIFWTRLLGFSVFLVK